MRIGIAMAIFMAWLCWPLIHSAMTIKPDGMDVPWWMRIIGVLVAASPVIASLTFVPVFIAVFMATTNAAESVIGDFIRRNTPK